MPGYADDVVVALLCMVLSLAPVVLIVGHGWRVGKQKSWELRPHPALLAAQRHAGKPAQDATAAPDTAPVEANDSAADVTPDADITMEDLRLRDPAGLAIAWSAFYGALYVMLAVIIVLVHALSPQPWAVAAACASIMLGYAFSVIAVQVIPLQRERRLVRKLASAFTAQGTSFTADDVRRGEADKVTLEIFRRVGESSTYLVKDGTSLQPRGHDVVIKALRLAGNLPSA